MAKSKEALYYFILSIENCIKAMLIYESQITIAPVFYVDSVIVFCKIDKGKKKGSTEGLAMK